MIARNLRSGALAAGLACHVVGCSSEPAQESGLIVDASTDVVAFGSDSSVDADATVPDVAEDARADADADAEADVNAVDSGPETCGMVDAPSTAKPYSEYVWPLWPIAPDSPGAAKYTATTILCDKVVTDETTGLMWAQDMEPGGGSYNWTDAKTRCAESRRAGFSDWRLPTRIELVSLFDYGTGELDSKVFAAPSSWSWSSSPLLVTGGVAQAYLVGGWGTRYESSSEFRWARCVRSAKTWPPSDAPPGHYSLLGATEVKDNRTGLIWSRAEEAGTYNWADARTRCADKGSGYRLPNVRELQSIVDETAVGDPKLDTTYFTGTPRAFVWTSTPEAGLPGRAMGVDFWGGMMIGNPSDLAWVVRCVR